MNLLNKLCLGTAQFGLDYGISNKTGKINYNEIENILSYCDKQNIDTIDTAHAYGDSEKTLGRFDLIDKKIITKIKSSDDLEISLENLKLSSVYGLMLHNENEADTYWNKLENYKKQGLAEKIGVSVYTPDKLLQITDNYPIDIVQFPLNILDQRFVPLLKTLKEMNIEIHTRSVFLQGLLLMSYNEIPDYFNPIKPVLNKIPDNKLSFTLNFVKNIDEIDKIVIGVTSKNELEMICNAYNETLPEIDYSEFNITDENMINPSLWKYK